MSEEMTISVSRLINPHCHLRERDVVRHLVYLARQGGAAVLGPMPNVHGGLTTAKQVRAYMEHVRSALDADQLTFLPIVMITENTTRDEIDRCIRAGIFDAKVYPRDRTTKSEAGVRHYARILEAVKRCGEVGMNVHFHPEHPWMGVSNRDAEYMFLPIVDMFLKETDVTIVWEHATDARCIPFWKEMAETGRFFVTITAHHLATDEDETFGDVRAACKPPIKTARDRGDLRRLVMEGHSWMMAGLDDAPHDISGKHPETGCCACGAYTAPFGLQLYAHALLGDDPSGEEVNIFDGFISGNARRLHELPDQGVISLVRRPFKIPLQYTAGSWTIPPFWAGREIDWSLDLTPVE